MAMENPPFMDDFPLKHPLHGISQLAMFDYRKIPPSWLPGMAIEKTWADDPLTRINQRQIL